MIAALLILAVASMAATIVIERRILRPRAIGAASHAAYLAGVRDTVRHTGPKLPPPATRP